MSKIFINENQLKEWVDSAKGIQERFGIDKALGYLIGEKFYCIVSVVHSSQKLIVSIAEEKKKPDYKSILETRYKDFKIMTNLDKLYKEYVGIISEAEELLVEFAALIKQTFYPYEIRNYFESNPRLGNMAQIASDEEYEFLVSRGIVEHSLDTEIEDALIFWDMMKHFHISLNNP
jgi:hypothetical protein